ncbi:MAG: YeeE/YedE family protein [Cyanobacteria bacterium P01_D01_bin.36]|mgnify:CR=1 FL=1
MAEFNWIPGLVGGLLIGLSATILLAFNGRIAGISGILSGSLGQGADVSWRRFFIVGMLLGGCLYEYWLAPSPTPSADFSPWAMAIGGLLVGFGTRLGNGCTSGHGVCGLGRLSVRSLVAVVTFLSTAMLTVFMTRHIL